jgi:hypothetical protein
MTTFWDGVVAFLQEKARKIGKVIEIKDISFEVIQI